AKDIRAIVSWNLNEQLQAICGPPGFFGLARTVGAWALVTIMAVLCWQQLRSRPGVVSASTAKQVADQGQPRAISQARIATPTNTYAQPLPLFQITRATGNASKSTVQSPEQASEQ